MAAVGAVSARPAVVVAIDGPSGSGKSTVARRVAQELGFRYLDTGAMYRALTWRVLEVGLSPADSPAVAALAPGLDLAVGTDPVRPTVAVDGVDVTDLIRTPAVTAAVSAVSAVPAVRERLVGLQRRLISAGDIVVEGRDIGTTVAPDAPVKVFLTAAPLARAERRQRETGEPDLAEVAAGLHRRDELDSGRAASPLNRAADAVEVDTTGLGIDEAVRAVLDLCVAAGVEPRRQGLVPLSPRRVALPDVPMRPRLYRLVKTVGRPIVRLILKVRVSGQAHVPRYGPVLLAGNHRGFLDGPLVAGFAGRDVYLVAKSELFRGPLARVLCWFGQIPVDRGRPDREALRRAQQVLRDGGALGMFPEGTRGIGALESIQHGIAYVALRVPGVAIVPVACRGTEAAWPKGRRLPRWRAPVGIVFGPPFRLAAPENPRSRRAVAAAAEEIRAQLQTHVTAVDAGQRG